MKRKEKIDIEKKAIETYGIEAQLRMLQEECGELIVAVGHYSRGREKTFNNLVEELVDVRIMIDQMVIGFGIKREVSRIMNFKLERLKKRLELR